MSGYVASEMMRLLVVLKSSNGKVVNKPLNDLVILRHKYINQLRWLHKIFLRDLN